MRRQLVLPLIGALGLAVAVASSPASALGLTGHTIGLDYYFPDSATVYPFPDASFTPPSFVVGPGQETDGNIEDVTHLLVDFTDDTLTITFDTILPSPTWNPTSFNGPIFTSFVPHDIATASVDGSTTMAGFDDTRVSFTSNQILVNWSGLSYVDGTLVKINFTFVPEPSAAALLALGVLALAARSRRRA